MYRSKLFFNFQFFNFIRQTKLKVNKNVKINYIEEVKSNYQILQKHVEKRDIKASNNIVNNFIDGLEDKNKVVNKLEEFKTKFPTQESFYTYILQDKQKQNPNFKMTDIKPEDIIKYMDPAILEIGMKLNDTITKNSKSNPGATTNTTIIDNKPNATTQTKAKANEKVKPAETTQALPEKKPVIEESETDIRKIQQKILGEFKEELNNKSNKKSKKKK